VPTDDLVNIYTELYGQAGLISSDAINNCTFLLYLMRSVSLSTHYTLHTCSYLEWSNVCETAKLTVHVEDEKSS